MNFHDLIGLLVVAGSTTLGGFIVACGLDIAAGVALAVRKHTFDIHKLPSFLAEQFATKQFLGVVSLGATAGLAALAASVQGGLTEVALQGVAQVALAAATAGAAALMASVLKDAWSKFAEFLGGPPAPPTPLPAPTPVTLVTPEGTPLTPPAGGTPA